ncbi:MgtC/SapB family protein [Rehaibacterium terrae]|jgi:uncharacterized membrane protein (DUF4010 family)|uniref:Uncharacterized membrane protein (DUF4010 family) n=1 Tax=Rehaibacterium terrae TaxID=1341696 RepID=A0A7W7XZY9_9GAMM|nr:DUF4010 domain-containing protein [Rehaibacterium terrae]MBB5015520.1 uncharacterized membrane protein (DUF4010 family) [Rehaibacterium terrae]
MAVSVDAFTGLATALGLGLLIGAVRERAGAATAGLRTHAIAALAGAVALWLSPWVLLVTLLAVAAFAALGYRRSAGADPGLTGEVALLLTPLLGALAMREPAWAAGLGVVAAVLLKAKSALHRFTRELLSERELHDALVLLASALVVLPLLPSEAIDPWGVLRPSALWRLVVLVMAVGLLGHVALRLVGARWGLPVAGFFAGFVSSTAAVAGFGQRVRATPSLRTYAVAAAMFANLASLLLFAAIVATLAPSLLRAALPPLAAAGLVLLSGGLFGLSRAPALAADLPPEPDARSFRLRHALLFALAIALVLLLSAWLRDWVGAHGALAAATLAALAEWHAAAATVAQLAAAGAIQIDQGRLGLVLLLAASTLAKSALAFVSGGRGYGLRVTVGLSAMTAAAAAALVLP